MANTTNRKPLPSIGVDRYTFFNVISDDAEGVKYGVPYALEGTVQITPTDAGGSDTFDADNGAYDVVTYIDTPGHDIENADIPPEVDALWRGLERNNGLVSVSKISKTTYFGVAWRILKTDGTYRYVKYYKGSYSFGSNVGAKTKPSKGASEKQTAKATYTAVHADYNDLTYSYIDQADIQFGEEGGFADLAAFEAAWFSDMSTLLDDEKITTETVTA